MAVLSVAVEDGLMWLLIESLTTDDRAMTVPIDKRTASALYVTLGKYLMSEVDSR